MTITAEDLAKAFSPIASIAKKKRVSVDLEKVANALVSGAADAIGGGDQDTKIDALLGRVTKIETLLDSATEDKDGNVFVEVVEKDDILKEFEIEKVTVASGDVATTPASPDATAKGEAHDDKKKPKKADDAEDDETETAKSDEDDLSDDIAWDRDLSPSRPPTLRGERLTKDERPIPARRGALSRMQKYQDSRERALARRAGDTGRSTS